MKKFLVLGGLFVTAGFANATLFTTTLFTTGADDVATPAVGESFVTAGNTYTANFTNATVNAPRTYLDITWWHTFDTTQSVAGSAAVPLGYDRVTQTITGRVRRTQGTGAVDVNVTLTETILNGTGQFNGSRNDNFDVQNQVGNVGTTYVPFTFTSSTNFLTPLTFGTAQKNDLIIRFSADTEVIIDSIQQSYDPVPEPATMTALALGGLGLIAKRRRK